VWEVQRSPALARTPAWRNRSPRRSPQPTQSAEASAPRRPRDRSSEGSLTAEDLSRTTRSVRWTKHPKALFGVGVGDATAAKVCAPQLRLRPGHYARAGPERFRRSRVQRHFHDNDCRLRRLELPQSPVAPFALRFMAAATIVFAVSRSELWWSRQKRTANSNARSLGSSEPSA
jgi:hypothetical protein